VRRMHPPRSDVAVGIPGRPHCTRQREVGPECADVGRTAVRAFWRVSEAAMWALILTNGTDSRGPVAYAGGSLFASRASARTLFGNRFA
jgi:hypothetical protein